MSKTRTCPGPPAHEFTYPGGRGRPPTYCAEHKPVVKPATKNTTKHLVESRTDDDPVRDKRDETKENPFIKKAQEQKKVQDREKMDRAREGKVKKAEELSNQRQADLEREFAEIDERVKACYAEYNRIFAKAKNSDDPKLWRQLESAQNSAVNASARKRFLYDFFDKHKIEQTEDRSSIGINEEHLEAMEALSEIMANRKVCECCERTQEPGEKGWVVDPNEGVDLCGDCARELGAIDPDYAGLVEEDSEDDSGYTDLLAKPEQFDDAHADFSEIIESELS